MIESVQGYDAHGAAVAKREQEVQRQHARDERVAEDRHDDDRARKTAQEARRPGRGRAPTPSRRRARLTPSIRP
jgi:hypothetical protein